MNRIPFNTSTDKKCEALHACSDHPFVSIIICTLGVRASLELCLDSLLTQLCCRSEIIVVLNGAGLEEIKRRLTRYPVRVISESRQGVCVARNRSVSEARGEVLCFLDDDVVAAADWLHQLVKGFEDPQVACVTGRVLLQGSSLPAETLARSYDSENAVSNWSLDRSEQNWYRKVLGPDIGFGCNMGFRKRFLQRYSFFPPAFGAGALIPAADEAYMFLRVVNYGFRIRHCAWAVVTHIYENDPGMQKRRTREVRSAIVAFHLKLLLEEKGFRFETLKLIFGVVRRRGRRVLQGVVFKKTHPPLSLLERLISELSGVWLYAKYVIVRRSYETKPSGGTPSARALACQDGDS